jgi:DNA-binding Lrp family transcriptional regulator
MLDHTDIRLLRELVRDPRSQVSQLSESLGMALRVLDQVLEVHEISGRGDVWCRVAAKDTHHLQSALRSILRIKGVIRTETVLALHEHIPYRVEPLLDRLLTEKSQGRPPAGN